MEPCIGTRKLIGDYLKKLFSNNPKNLGLWGFTVDDSPQKPALRTTKLLPGETRTITAVVIGSVLTNIEKAVIEIYKENGKMQLIATLAAGEKMGIVKGMSTLIVTNQSTLEEAEFTVTRAK